MPQPILDRLTSQLKAKGMDTAKARAVAIATLQKSGVLHKGTTILTDKGIHRQNMGAAGRAKDRAAKANGGRPDDYVYDSKTNIAHKKPGV